VARDFKTRLTRRAAKAGVFLDEELAAALASYYDLLSRWNRKINLTALDNPDEAIDRLLLEPVIAAKAIAGPGSRELMDVGSGGGSPAIPLALALGADVRLTMVEVKARKSAFLREAVRQLGLRGAFVETSRHEELLARPELLEKFDLLSLRAIRVEPKILMTLQAFIRPGGQLLLFRGPAGPEHLQVIHPLAWESTHPLVETLQSRLSILRKRSSGAGVPRGTLPLNRPIAH
jgi:16S rRNA (guanine527-N7)-methyltransferase